MSSLCMARSLNFAFPLYDISLQKKTENGNEPTNTMVGSAIDWHMLEISVVDFSKLEKMNNCDYND